MMLARALFAFAALSLAAAGPASAQSAAPLSLAQSPAMERAGADLGQVSDLRGATPWILGVVVLGALIFIIIELGDENDLPNSP
jgi:hypothetical protein